jgi:predicted nucleic-acid-binding protein
MALPFLDTNILLRHLREDDPVSPKATSILSRVEQGDLQV